MLDETTDSIIHYESALERIGGDREFFDELLVIYQEEGSSANLSLIQLRDKAHLIETAGRESDLVLAQRSTEELKTEFQRLKEHLAANRSNP
jgi:HPt (histidine-containing phosphotransfer) domain-containing protein